MYWAAIIVTSTISLILNRRTNSSKILSSTSALLRMGLVKISKQRAFPFVEQSAVLPLRERIELRLRIAAGEGGRQMLMYLVVAPHELCGPQYGYFA